MRPILLVLAMLACATLQVAIAAGPKAPERDHYVVVVGMATEQEIAADPNVAVIVGAMRSDQLREKLEKLDTKHVKGIISFGVAGGLDPKLKVGELLVPSEVVFQGQRLSTDKVFSQELKAKIRSAGVTARDGVIAGVEEMTDGNIEWRKKLRAESKADIVDMESHIAAEFAARRGVPFAAVRVLSDAVGDIFPSAARVPLDEEGEVQKALVFREIFKHPSQVPALTKIGRNFNAALKVLESVKPKLYGNPTRTSAVPLAQELWSTAEANISSAE